MEIAHLLNEDVWSAWLHAAWNLGDPGGYVEVLLAALAEVDAAPVRAWRDPLAFVEPMAESVSSAMYWQPPHDQDVVLTDSRIAAVLRPVAEVVAEAPATDWWTTPVDLSALRYTSLFDNEAPSPPVLEGARGRLNGWRERRTREESDAADRPADPAAPLSAFWWCTPVEEPLVTTTRPLPGLGSVELVWEEDDFGLSDAEIWPLAPTRAPRVWEIDGPESWTRLVDRYPLEMTNARRHDWYRVTGRVGRWCIPDWNAVAADWDAVHLTVAGYLTTATRACILADGESATVLGGWNPDQTWWLTDVLAEASGPQRWHDSGGASGTDLVWQPLPSSDRHREPRK